MSLRLLNLIEFKCLWGYRLLLVVVFTCHDAHLNLADVIEVSFAFASQNPTQVGDQHSEDHQVHEDGVGCQVCPG